MAVIPVHGATWESDLPDSSCAPQNRPRVLRRLARRGHVEADGQRRAHRLGAGLPVPGFAFSGPWLIAGGSGQR